VSGWRVHLDTDLGGDIDDLCALALLVGWPGVTIAGVTTVVENEGRRAGYARDALDRAGRAAVPVAAGAEVSLGCFREAYGLPPEARYWPEPVAPRPGPLDGALDLLRESVRQGATVIAIGPLTNLARLEQRWPGTLRQATLCLMGSHLSPAPPGFPAWDYRMDFNLQADAAAAHRVLAAADPARLTLVPIEVTAQTALRRADLPALGRGDPLARLIARQAEAFAEDERLAPRYGATCPALPADLINFQHDPLTAAVALGWDGVTIETVPLAFALEGGWLRMRAQPGGRPVRVVTGVDRERFAARWLAAVAGRPE
jgi:purine nucleosidase